VNVCAVSSGKIATRAVLRQSLWFPGGAMVSIDQCRSHGKVIRGSGKASALACPCANHCCHASRFSDCRTQQRPFVCAHSTDAGLESGDGSDVEGPLGGSCCNITMMDHLDGHARQVVDKGRGVCVGAMQKCSKRNLCLRFHRTHFRKHGILGCQGLTLRRRCSGRGKKHVTTDLELTAQRGPMAREKQCA
jgi:hypothetical protein